MGPRKRGRLCTVCPTKGLCVHHIRGFPGGSVVKNPPANACQRRRRGVRSLGQEDPLEKEMATHSSTLVWEIPWTEEPGGLQSTGSQRVGHDLGTEQQETSCQGRDLPGWGPQGQSKALSRGSAAASVPPTSASQVAGSLQVPGGPVVRLAASAAPSWVKRYTGVPRWVGEGGPGGERKDAGLSQFPGTRNLRAQDGIPQFLISSRSRREWGN